MTGNVISGRIFTAIISYLYKVGTSVTHSLEFASTKLGFELRPYSSPKHTCIGLLLWETIETVKDSGHNQPQTPFWPMAGLHVILPGGVNLIRSPCPRTTAERLSCTGFLVTFLLGILSCSKNPQAFSHES